MQLNNHYLQCSYIAHFIKFMDQVLVLDHAYMESFAGRQSVDLLQNFPIVWLQLSLRCCVPSYYIVFHPTELLYV